MVPASRFRAAALVFSSWPSIQSSASSDPLNSLNIKTPPPVASGSGITREEADKDDDDEEGDLRKGRIRIRMRTRTRLRLRLRLGMRMRMRMSPRLKQSLPMTIRTWTINQKVKHSLCKFPQW